jgi:hypothetical protein
MRKILFFLLLIGGSTLSHAQKSTDRNKDSLLLVDLTKEIDQAVVNKDTVLLRKRYADDFVFSHGSGKVEGRSSWFASLMKNNYPERSHDSITVELHPALAIVKGKMTIQRVGKDKTDKYYLKYIRVFARREQNWWLISHSTTWEFHEP